MKSILYKTIWVILLFIVCSCQKPLPRDIGAQDNIISWTVGNIHTIETKSLISSQNDLELNCTPIDKYWPNDYDVNKVLGKGESIGFYADYIIYDKANVILRERNIFPKDTRLLYTYNPIEKYKWYYGSNAQAWRKDGGVYHIRAIYPQTLINEIIPNSTAECFVLEYNSQQHQEDLMISGNRILTNDPITHNPSISVYQGEGGERIISEITGSNETGYGYNYPFNLSNPIPLFFKHCLAAIRVQFKYSYIEDEDDSDILYYCYFTNGASGGLHTSGLLIYGDDLTERPVGDTQEDLEHRWKTFKWQTYRSVLEGIPFYRWGDISKTTGISFSQVGSLVGGVHVVNDYAAIAYSKYDRRKHNYYEGGHLLNSEEIPGTSIIPMTFKEEAPFYNDNDGWLLILPQAAPTDLTLHFCTKKLGELSVKIPPVTLTDNIGNKLSKDGYRIDEYGNPISGDIYDHYFCDGYKYTYTVEVNAIDSRVEISIMPWSQISSSTYIDFEL